MERSFAMEILDILAQDARTSAAIIAQMLNSSEEAVKAEIKRMEDEKILLRYSTIIDEEKTESESTIHALIEVKVTPQYRQGYDAIAEQISRYPEVRACYLMSGSYDFMVLVDGPKPEERFPVRHRKAFRPERRRQHRHPLCAAQVQG